MKSHTETVHLPQGVSAKLDGFVLMVKGPKGEVTKELKDSLVTVAVNGNDVAVTTPKSSRAFRMRQGTFVAHVGNMVRGVTQGYVYKLKVCSGHFPMTVAVAGDLFTVKNYIGEKTPRTFKVDPRAKINVAGDDITIESVDKEVAGQTAASIEQITRRTGFDIRIFQSGIYITDKAGKEM